VCLYVPGNSCIRCLHLNLCAHRCDRALRNSLRNCTHDTGFLTALHYQQNSVASPSKRRHVRQVRAISVKCDPPKTAAVKFAAGDHPGFFCPVPPANNIDDGSTIFLRFIYAAYRRHMLHSRSRQKKYRYSQLSILGADAVHYLHVSMHGLPHNTVKSFSISLPLWAEVNQIKLTVYTIPSRLLRISNALSHLVMGTVTVADRSTSAW
jgi:hypothetical protein